jgi:preprotein translocase subunit SecE
MSRQDEVDTEDVVTELAVSEPTEGRRPRRARPPATARKRTPPTQFLREVRDEMRQVAWPTRPELFNYTAVVLTTLIIMILLIFLLNLAFGKAITLLFQK